MKHEIIIKEKVRRFVDDSFGKQIPHHERTVFWLLRLKPDADEAMQIAAYSHDIDRAFRKLSSAETFRNNELNDHGIIKEHQNKGARIMTEYLIKENVSEAVTRRVAHMIAKHEVGGDAESDLIKDADSISYLENNASMHAEGLAKLLGTDKIKRKFDWMYDRVTNEKAHKIAKPFYDKALELLENKEEK